MNMNEFSIDFISYLLTQTQDMKGFLQNNQQKTLREYLEEEKPEELYVKLGFLAQKSIDYSLGYHHVYKERNGEKIPEKYLDCNLIFLVHTGLKEMEEEAKCAMEEINEDIQLDKAAHYYSLLTIAYQHRYQNPIPETFGELDFERLTKLIKLSHFNKEEIMLLSDKKMLNFSETQKEKISQLFEKTHTI